MGNRWTPKAIRDLDATTALLTLGAVTGFGGWQSYHMAHTGGGSAPVCTLSGSAPVAA
jgi:hypothetical protein